MAEQPLSGVNVVDLSQGIAGPFCTKLLADYGAEVVKIEPPNGGDPARKMGPFPGNVPHQEKSGTFLYLNTNKLGITLNVESETGKRILRKLVEEADILVESHAPQVSQSLGITYQEMVKVNPDLIMTSVTPFGLTGPYRNLKASELVLFGMGGILNNTGLPDRYPVKYGGNHVQYQAGNSAALATLFAFYGREYAGLGGQQVDVSIFETQLASINSRTTDLLRYQYNGERGLRTILKGNGYPAGVYPCSDGYINVWAGGSNNWPRTVAALEMPELLNDPRFSTREAQADPEREEEFTLSIWLPWCLERTMFEATEQLQKYSILSAPVNNVERAVENPQMEYRQYFTPIEHPVAGTFRYPGAPFKNNGGRWWQIHRPAPTLGQHNEEIYSGRLGYAKEDLIRIRERGVI